VPNWAGDGAERGDRWWGGSSSHRRRWRRGVLSSRVPEGSGEVARELLQVGVVLLVPLAGVKRLCNGGAMATPSGGETEACRAVGDGGRARENETGWAWEHQ
jgi:hypothetical protein